MAAQLAADDALAADAGRELLAKLSQKWHEQGYNARLMGIPITDMLDRSMRAGWREADAEIAAVHAESESRLATGEGYSWDLPSTPAVIAAIRSTQAARSTRRRGASHVR